MKITAYIMEKHPDYFVLTTTNLSVRIRSCLPWILLLEAWKLESVPDLSRG
jgi:hypothetical protein